MDKKKCLAVTTASIAMAIGFATTAIGQMLPGSEWSPVELNGEEFVPVAETFLRFEADGRFFGNGGCNTIRGSFVTNADAILFGPAASTMMACPEEISQQEFQFLQTLNSVRQFEQDGKELILSNVGGEIVLRMIQRNAD